MKNLLTIAISILLLVVAAPAYGQMPPGNVITVGNNVTGATVLGKLVLLPDQVIFIDDSQPGYSYVVNKNEIDSLKVEGTTITIETKKPVHDRNGQATRLTFTAITGGDPTLASKWYERKEL